MFLRLVQVSQGTVSQGGRRPTREQKVVNLDGVFFLLDTMRRYIYFHKKKNVQKTHFFVYLKKGQKQIQTGAPFFLFLPWAHPSVRVQGSHPATNFGLARGIQCFCYYIVQPILQKKMLRALGHWSLRRSETFTLQAPLGRPWRFQGKSVGSGK